MTTGTPAGRAAQLDTTGVPIAFEVIAAFEVEDVTVAERRAHAALASRRVRPSREFFYATPADAVPRVEAALGLAPRVKGRRRVLSIARRIAEALGWLVVVLALLAWLSG